MAYGSTLYHASRPAEAIAVFQKVLRLCPLKPPSMALTNIANSYRTLGQYDEAVRFYKKLLKEYPDHFSGNIALTATYSLMDRPEEARAQAEEVMRLNPKFSMERWARTIRFKDPAEVERILEALRKAGLK